MVHIEGWVWSFLGSVMFLVFVLAGNLGDLLQIGFWLDGFLHRVCRKMRWCAPVLYESTTTACCFEVQEGACGTPCLSYWL